MPVTVGSRATRIVAVAKHGTTVTEAAKLMREHHVGALIVVENAPPHDRPIGIVTDRDIVVEVTAPGLDPETITVGDIMSGRPAVVKDSDDLFDAVQLMRRRGVRRLPVVDAQDRLVGVFAMDDLLEALLEELAGVVKAIGREQQQESRTRRGQA